MTVGTAIVIVGIIWLMIQSRTFRLVAFAAGAVVMVFLVLVVVHYRQETERDLVSRCSVATEFPWEQDRDCDEWRKRHRAR